MLTAPSAFIDRYLRTGAEQNTGGTSGRTLTLQRSPEELAFVSQFFAAMHKQTEHMVPPCITAMGSYHGQATEIPYFGPVDSCDFAQITGPDPFELFLAEQGRRDTILVGLESQVRIVTTRLMEGGFDFSRSRICQIVTTGDFVTNRLRNWFERVWDVTLHSRYSLSEVFGGADVCSSCGLYHCDPNLIAELVDPLTLTPMEEGVGMLVLTCLFPFIQKQPMIRYATGDLVEYRRDTCGTDTCGFRLLGRLSHSAVGDVGQGTQLFVSGNDLYDVLDEFPDTNRSGMFDELRVSADPQSLGHVRAGLETSFERGTASIKVLVETRYAPHMYLQRAAEFAHAVETHLLERSAVLAEGVHAGWICFAVVPVLPGMQRSFQSDEAE